MTDISAEVDALLADAGVDMPDILRAAFHEAMQNLWTDHLARVEHELLYGTGDGIPVGLIHD
jgi:hypothetical protein